MAEPVDVVSTQVAAGDPSGAVRAERCAFCRRPLPASAGVGRPRTYCRRSCRQRAFEQRRRSTELSWGDDRLAELIRQLEARGDRLAHVADVLDEVRRDLDDDVVLDVAEVLERLDAALR